MKYTFIFIAFFVCQNAFAQASEAESDSLIVGAINAPNAEDDRMKLNLKRGNTDVEADLAKNDKNTSKNLTYSILTPPKRGQIMLTESGKASYIPFSTATKIDFDSFEYQVCNADNECAQAAVYIEIITTEIPPKNRRGLYVNPTINIGNTINDARILWGYETVRTPLSADLTALEGTSLGFGLELDYYFSNTIGIGIGAQYYTMTGGFDLNGFNVKYASNLYNNPVENRYYERIVTINNLTENFELTSIGIPFLLKFRTHPEHKIGLFAQVGIQYNLMSNSTSNLTGAFANYEAIRYNNNGNNEPLYGETGDIDNKFTWLQTLESYSEDGTNVTEHFDELYSDVHNIGINIPLGDGDNSTELDAHLNVLGRIGLAWNVSQSFAFQVGGQVFGSALLADDNYQITDRIVGENSDKYGTYTTLLRGGPRILTYGLVGGISLRLSGKR